MSLCSRWRAIDKYPKRFHSFAPSAETLVGDNETECPRVPPAKLDLGANSQGLFIINSSPGARRQPTQESYSCVPDPTKNV